MRDIGVKIRIRRKQLGWTVQKLATLAGIDNGFLSKLETGKATGSWDTYTKIAGAMGISVDAFLVSKSNVEHAEIGSRRIPVLDYIQAGQWRGVVPDLESRETILTDLEHPPSTFAMRINGDSMEPEFKAGDIVVINPTLQPKPGDYVVATEGTGEATFKQYRDAGRNDQGRNVFELVPLNQLYGPLRSDRVSISIVGVMVEHRRYRRR